LIYETPEVIAGAINATINPEVGTQELYADDQLWESVSTLGKIDVEVETADLPLAVRAKILGNELERWSIN
jgi:phi13 family phage major tail protein